MQQDKTEEIRKAESLLKGGKASNLDKIPAEEEIKANMETSIEMRHDLIGKICDI